MTLTSHEMPQGPSSAQKFALIISWCALVFGDQLFNILELGTSVGERSDAAQTALTPPGFAFAIWGPIFLLLALFIGFALSRWGRSSFIPERVAWPISIAMAFAALWQIWARFVGLEVGSVVIILLALTFALRSLFVIAAARPLWRSERWCAQLPFGLFAGWLTAASFVNFASVLTRYFPEAAWMQGSVWLGGLLILLLCAGLLAIIKGAGVFYAVGLLWALGTGAWQNWYINEQQGLAAIAFGAILILFGELWRSAIRSTSSRRATAESRGNALPQGA